MVAVTPKSMYDHFRWEIGVYGTVGIVAYVVGGHLHGDRSCFSTSIYEESIDERMNTSWLYSIPNKINIFYICYANMVSRKRWRYLTSWWCQIISDVFRKRICTNIALLADFCQYNLLFNNIFSHPFYLVPTSFGGDGSISR